MLMLSDYLADIEEQAQERLERIEVINKEVGWWKASLKMACFLLLQ